MKRFIILETNRHKLKESPSKNAVLKNQNMTSIWIVNEKSPIQLSIHKYLLVLRNNDELIAD